MSGTDTSPQGERPPFEPGTIGREKPLRALEPTEALPAGSPESVSTGGDPAPHLAGLLPYAPADVPVAVVPGSDDPPAPPSPSAPLAFGPYPMRYDVAYPERLSRLKTFFRGLLIIPVWLFLYFVTGITQAGLAAGWTTVFFRKRYPRWLFAANSGAVGFLSRAWAYAALQTDRYPSFDTDTSPVTLEYDEPLQHQISRWRVFFWKGILLVPHFIVLSLLQLATGVVVFISWWAVMLSGRYPRGMFGFVTGITRWHLRVLGYFASFNDRFPPFSLSASAGPASTTTAVVNGVIGALVSGSFIALVVVAIAIADDPRTETVDYASLRGASSGGTNARVAQGAVRVNARGGMVDLVLSRVDDPGEQLVPLLVTGKNQRVVVFEWTIRNSSDMSARVSGTADARLAVLSGDERKTSDAELVVVAGQVAPASVKAGGADKIQAVFVIPKDARPVALRFSPDFTPRGGIEYQFE